MARKTKRIAISLLTDQKTREVHLKGPLGFECQKSLTQAAFLIAEYIAMSIKQKSRCESDQSARLRGPKTA